MKLEFLVRVCSFVFIVTVCFSVVLSETVAVVRNTGCPELELDHLFDSTIGLIQNLSAQLQYPHFSYQVVAFR